MLTSRIHGMILLHYLVWYHCNQKNNTQTKKQYDIILLYSIILCIILFIFKTKRQ